MFERWPDAALYEAERAEARDDEAAFLALDIWALTRRLGEHEIVVRDGGFEVVRLADGWTARIVPAETVRRIGAARVQRVMECLGVPGALGVAADLFGLRRG